MKSVAIITARGGSKRIPRKNIKPFLGRPILEYSIEAALQAGMFEEVMVSTDDGEIAQVAKKAGAKVPFFRSEKTANDFATTADVIEEVLASYEQIGRTFGTVCCIYPTAPFVTADAIRKAMMLLEQEAPTEHEMPMEHGVPMEHGHVDCVIPVVRFSFPPQRGVVVRDGRLTPKWPENMAKRSQDLEPLYHDCGQFYCLNVDSFKRQKTIWMANAVPFIQDERYVQDIDTPEDWRIAEVKYKLMQSEGFAGEQCIE